MRKSNKNECINVNFSKGLGIFDGQTGYPVIDDQEKNTGRVRDIQGIQAHAGRNFFVPEGIAFSIDIYECPNFQVAIRRLTCL